MSVVYELKEKYKSRFLREDRASGKWLEVTSDEKARQKVAIALRDYRKIRSLKKNDTKSTGLTEVKKKKKEQDNNLEIDLSKVGTDSDNLDSSILSASGIRVRSKRKSSTGNECEKFGGSYNDRKTQDIPKIKLEASLTLSTSTESSKNSIKNCNQHDSATAYAFVNMDNATLSKRQRCFNGFCADSKANTG